MSLGVSNVGAGLVPAPSRVATREGLPHDRDHLFIRVIRGKNSLATDHQQMFNNGAEGQGGNEAERTDDNNDGDEPADE